MHISPALVQFCVSFFYLGNNNAVYKYFYPDYYSKLDLMKVLKLLAALTVTRTT